MARIARMVTPESPHLPQKDKQYQDAFCDEDYGEYLGLAEKVVPRIRSFSRGQPDNFRPS